MSQGRTRNEITNDI